MTIQEQINAKKVECFDLVENLTYLRMQEQQLGQIIEQKRAEIAELMKEKEKEDKENAEVKTPSED